MNLALKVRKVLVVDSRSIEFDFGLYTFVFPDESSVVARRSICHRRMVY